MKAAHDREEQRRLQQLRSMGLKRHGGPLLAELPLILLSASILLLMVRTFAARVGFPYDLEWMEGGMLLHSLRVMEGHALYVEPRAEFIPYIYPPMYAWLVAAIGKITGLTYAVGRSLAFAGSMAGAAALVCAVRKEGASWAFGLGAAALFLSGYDESGGFYDLVRNDGLLIGLLGWALVAGRWGHIRTCGILLTLAFATKHNAALFGLPILIWLWKTQGRSVALRFALWSMGPALTFVALMMFEGDGLFLEYLLGVPGHHPFVLKRFFPLSPKEMLSAMPYAMGVVALIAVLWCRRWNAAGAYWVANGVLAFVLSMFMRGHYGGYMNVLIPGIWALSLWVALAANAVVVRWPRVWVRAVLAVGLAAQLFTEGWSVDRYAPTQKDLEAGAQVVAAIQEIEGPVLAPQFPWYPVMAGKAPAFHLIAFWDIDRDGGPLQDQAVAVSQSIRARRWAAVLVDQRAKLGGRLKRVLKKNYARSENISLPSRGLILKTGWKVRPKTFYLPNPEPAAGASSDQTEGDTTSSAE